MAHQEQIQSGAANFFAGLVIGGLTGAAISLLMAPQSGRETRAQLQKTGIELRDEVTSTAGTVRDQARETGQRISTAAEQLKKHGEELVEEGKEYAATLSRKQNNKGRDSR